MFDVPILFLIFNRPQVSLKVFQKIRKIRPQKLYLASDGPRSDQEREKEIVCNLRENLLELVDWKCELKTLFRNENLGCGRAVSGAIDWFFSEEERGIILEDDCLPSDSFFPYCAELLQKYENDLRVWSIGGFSPLAIKANAFSYNFSRYSHIWGWATWASRWKQYDFDIEIFKKEGKKLFRDYEFFHSVRSNKKREKILKKMLEMKIDTWDYQWNYIIRINNGLSIRPSINLVQNIGFGDCATHTKNLDNSIVNNKACEISFPLEHPDFIMVYRLGDELSEKDSYIRKFLRVINKIKGIICA